MAGGFEANTRKKLIRQPALVKPAGGGPTTLAIQRTGLLARIYLNITGTVSGSGAALNPLGLSSIIRRVRLVANSGLELFSVSGPGYAHILQHLLESERGPVTPANQGTNVVADGAFNLDMMIPVCVSLMNFTGLVLTQSEQILVTLEIDWEADTAVGGAGTTVTATATPYVEFFSIPSSPEDAPDLTRAHVILEDTRTIAGPGEQIYEPLRRPTYLQLAHGFGFAAGNAGVDNFDRLQLRIEQSNYLFDGDVNAADIEFNLYHGIQRPRGIWVYDFMASSGLGNYLAARDRVNTSLITSFESVFNATAAGTLYTIRRMLIDLAS